MVLYGREAWTILKEDLQAFGVVEQREVKTFFDNVQENGVWWWRINHELARHYGEHRIQKVAKASIHQIILKIPEMYHA